MSSVPPKEHEFDLHGGYDPELPFLYALEREIARHARRAHELREGRRRRASAIQAQTPGSTPGALTRSRDQGIAADGRWRGTGARGRRRQRALLPAGTRMARRALTLVALLCLIGASAYGAGKILSAGPTSPAVVAQSALVEVANGHSGPDRWSLRVYLRAGELCRVLVVADTESSRCSAPPSARSLGVTSVDSPTRRYVYGVSGPAVARVLVHAAAAFSTTPTHALGEAAAALGLPRHGRWFVAVLRRPVGEPDPRAIVRGTDASGSVIGAPVSDCAEATEAQLCPR